MKSSTIKELINGPLQKQGREAFWKRDFVSAQKIFRAMLVKGCWRLGDLKYILPSLLPLSIYRCLTKLLEKNSQI
jgi:hypothetical protein